MTSLILQGTEQQAGLVTRVLDPDLGNTMCVDCGASDPEWVSLNLGVVMCITCSAAHRAMGSHVSQVWRIFRNAFARIILHELKVT